MISQTSSEEYAKAKKIFFAALELDAPERPGFVRTKCGDDADLLCEVESLLALRDEANGFLELPAFETISRYKNLKNEIIGGYRLVRELGTGGMGVVYLAEKDDADFHRQVALKIVKNSLHSKTLFSRFNLERRILAQLEHPNIARLIDGGTTQNGLPYFVMEYVEGISLIEYDQTNNLPLAERLELFRQVCAAVSYAHKNAVIHRDLKPSNILVTQDGTTKLLDFGISKLLSSETLPQPATATTFRAMTPEFASPEQIKGETVTTVSDVYSLGVILYELLTGARPYKINSENLNEIIRAVCEIQPERPSSVVLRYSQRKAISPPNGQRTKDKGRRTKSLKGDLDNIILKALRKEPTRRYSSVEALSEDLRRHLKGLPVSARRDTFAYRAEKFIRRNRAAAALAALGILVLFGGIVATVWQARRAEQERARAERRFNDVRTLANSFMFELNDEILKGQTQGRELVVKRALEYLNRLADEAKDDASLQRELAVAYLKIGDIQGKPHSPNLGNTEGAIESYRKALTILETLHQADSINPQTQRDLSTAYLSIGSMQAVRTLKNDEAIENLQKSLALCESLITANPTNTEYRRMLADIYKSLGDALRHRDERITLHRKALALREELLAADPTNTKELTAIASIHQRIGTLLSVMVDGNHSTDKYRAKLEHFDKSLAIYKTLQGFEPNNLRHRRNFADITAMRMPVQANLADKAGVMSSYNTAMETFRELAAADPKNAEAQLDIAYTHQLICQSLLKLNDIDGAVKSCRQGLEVSESLFAIDPTNAEVRAYIFLNYEFTAEALKKAGNTDRMLKNLQQMLATAEKWLSAEPENVSNSKYVIEASIRIGSFYAEIASDSKISPKKKKEHWQSARYWFIRSLNVLRDLQKRNAATETYITNINAVEQEIARCDAALK